MAYADVNNPSFLNASETPDYYVPSEEEKQDIDLVFSLLEQGKKSRAKYDKHWDKWEKFYDGDQWEIKRSEGKAMPVANIIRTTIQAMIPILTDSQPGFNIGAKTPQDYEFSDLLGTLVDTWWNLRSMNMTLTNTIMQSLMYHCGVQKVIWDESLEGGLGDVRVDDINPRDVWVPEDAIDFDKNCPWVIHRMCKTLGEIRRLFPDKAKQIVTTGSDKEKTSQQAIAYDGHVELVSPVDKKDRNAPTATGSDVGMNTKKIVEIYELWIDDESLINIDEEDKYGNKKQITKKRYPQGKIITVTSNKILLQSAESPRKDGKKPYVRYVDMMRPNRFYGDGEIEQLFEMQRLLNKVLANITDCFTMMGNPTWIIDTNSGVDPEMITNIVGQIITKNPGSEVRREQAPPMPAYIMNFYIELQKLIDQISGMHDITQGRKPTGVTAAEAISELQEAAQTRIRLKERNLQSSLTQLGHLVINTMMQYYTVPRVARITKNTKWPEFFEFYFKNTEDQGLQYIKKTYEFNEEQKKYISSEDWLESGYSKGDFDIDVKSGTSLPFMREKRSQLALRLYNAAKPAIDQQDLLDKLEWPKKDETIRRMKEEQAAQAAQPPQGM
jgi:hypothetical protein